MKKIRILTILGLLIFALGACAFPNELQGLLGNAPSQSPGADTTLSPLPPVTTTPVTAQPSTQPGSDDPALAFEAALKITEPVDIEGPSKAMTALLLMGSSVSDDNLEDFLSYHAALCDVILGAENVLNTVVDMTLEEQKGNFYAVALTDGAFQLKTDMQALTDALDGRLSEEAQKYFEIESEFAQDVLIEDGKLMQSWDYLAEYMLRYYDYIYEDNANFQRTSALRKYSDAYEIYTGKLALDNSPAILDDKLIQPLRESYKTFLSRHADSPLAEDIREISEKWEANNYEYNDDVQDVIDIQADSVDREVQRNSKK